MSQYKCKLPLRKVKTLVKSDLYDFSADMGKECKQRLPYMVNLATKDHKAKETK